MRARSFVILILVSLLVCSIPAYCEENAAASAPAAAVEKPAAPAPAEAAPTAPAAPAAAPAPVVPAPAPAAAVPAPAAPVAPAAAPVVAPAPAPVVAIAPVTVQPDTKIFRRTPKLDGIVDDGEWDTFYTCKNGDWELTTYADWDTENLYVAVKSNKPVDMMAVLDANADGWYNGEDNYEVRAIRDAGDTHKIEVSRYDSRRTKTPTASPVTPAEAAVVEMKSGVSNGMSSIEMRIPADLVRRFKLGDGRKIGLLIAARTGLDETGWVASGSPGDARESTLVTKKIASLKPLELGFDLRDARIARGEDLVAKFHLSNVGADTIDVRSFVIAGEGKAGEYLSSEKVRMEGLVPKKHVSHDIRSIIPADMPLGSWAIGAEVKSTDGKLGGALVSFEVVEPFEIALRLPNEPVKTTAKDVTLGVVITNNMSHSARGQAKITLPAGWELWKNDNSREFSVSGDSLTTVTFKSKAPLGVLGEVPVKMDVTINGKTVTIEGKFSMVNP